MKPIRVLLVEDSPIALAILKRILSASPDIEIVGTARTGLEAIALIPKVQPQVICTDLHMPEMNGLELTKVVMSTTPKPILVISTSVQHRDSEKAFQMLQAGAVDIFPKPSAGLGTDYIRIQQELISRIKVLAGVSVFTLRGTRVQEPVSSPPTPSPPPIRSESVPVPSFSSKVVKMIAIGASTGGPQALQKILSQLPKSLPVPIICVQHISEGFLQGLITWLDQHCELTVMIAPSGELPKPGFVYFPPERQHLELNSVGRFIHSSAPPVGGHRPSIDVTFSSVAQFYGAASMGILLTGMGRDGAEGLLKMSKAGGLTIAQNEETCVVFGMPNVAIALGGAQQVLPVEAIAPTLLNHLPR